MPLSPSPLNRVEQENEITIKVYIYIHIESTAFSNLQTIKPAASCQTAWDAREEMSLVHLRYGSCDKGPFQYLQPK